MNLILSPVAKQEHIYIYIYIYIKAALFKNEISFERERDTHRHN